MEIIFSKEEIEAILEDTANDMLGGHFNETETFKVSTSFNIDYKGVTLETVVKEVDPEGNLEIRQDDDGTDFFYDGDPLKGMPDETKS